jgi:hypothetical protein
MHLLQSCAHSIKRLSWCTCCRWDVLKNLAKPLQMLITDAAQYSYAGFNIMPRAATEVGWLLQQVQKWTGMAQASCHPPGGHHQRRLKHNTCKSCS